MPRNAADVGPSDWACATHVGELDEALGSWLQLVPMPATDWPVGE